MSSLKSTKLLASSHVEGSLGYQARARRAELLLEHFPDFAEMEIVDLGGDVRFWQGFPLRPKRALIVTLEPQNFADAPDWVDGITADACDPAGVDGTFDLVFSNSVIEHVGGPRYRRGFAETVHQLGPRHWIQTPYRYFPLEPHLMFPGFQFLPPRTKLTVVRHWPLSAWRDWRHTDPVQYLMDHELLTRTEMKALFPESRLVTERAAGLPKSIIAVR